MKTPLPHTLQQGMQGTRVMPVSQNNRIILGLWKALTAMQWLRAQGITVLKVEVEHTRPVIWVQPSDSCGVLEAEQIDIRNRSQHLQRVMLCEVNGCKVQWQLGSD